MGNEVVATNADSTNSARFDSRRTLQISANDSPRSVHHNRATLMTTPRIPRQPIFIQLFGTSQVEQVVQLVQRLWVGAAAIPQFVAQRPGAVERRLTSVHEGLDRYDDVVIV